MVRGATPISPVNNVGYLLLILELDLSTTKSGNEFGGWDIYPSCTAKLDYYAPLTTDITLYAKWLEVTEPAETTKVEVDGILYTLSDVGNSYCIYGCSDRPATEIVISSECNGLLVTEIGDSAFGWHIGLKSITIP